MPLTPIQRLWEHGSRFHPLDKHVAKLLRDVGGWAVYRDGYLARCPMVVRVHWYESFGCYPWRVSLREASTVAEVWREVEQYPTFREADAAARRFVRRNAVATSSGEDEWKAYPVSG
jgi:hypothetical protein